MNELISVPPVPTIDHAGDLEDLEETPAYLVPSTHVHSVNLSRISCSFCGVGDGGTVERVPELPPASDGELENGPATTRRVSVFRESIKGTQPTSGCVKLRLLTMKQRAAFPIHTMPSVLDRSTGKRRAVSYTEAIERLGELLLAHRGDKGRTLLYASGQIDYFSVFAVQEVFRLLGARNITGNAEHCLNSGAMFAELLTGAPGPILTIDLAMKGPGRFYLLNGWNGFIAHPPVFAAMTKRPDFDGFLVEVQVTETAKLVAKHLGKERVVLIRSRTDPHFALSVAHEILTRHPQAVEDRFVQRFADPQSFGKFAALAQEQRFAPERVAGRIAAEPAYEERVLQAIRVIAQKMAEPGLVPVNIGSMGLSQTSGVVTHCLWACVMAMVGKYGVHPDGRLAGGTLRLAGQINAESEIQGLSRKYFMGRIPIAEHADAARRMGLPDNAYEPLTREKLRPALDYAEPTPGERELFVCVGTQFEANMMGRRRWLEKLKSDGVTLAVIDPIPDPWTLEHAELVIPSPPHPATTKLYQNGEWKMTLSIPQKRAAPETRSDATILYDAMAAVTRRVAADPSIAPDLAGHLEYMRERFGEGLARNDGEVNRDALWTRIMAYMSGGRGPLYCRPDHPDGRPIAWSELLEHGQIYYGGVGKTRAKLDYDNPEHHAFRDIFRRPSKFKFFVPTDVDLAIPEGTILNSGRSQLSDDRTPLQVTEILKETPDVTTFRFQGERPCRFVYWPGQFCTFVLDIDGKKVVRSYSISSTPTRPYSLEVTVKRVPGGVVSNWLPDNLKVGDRVEIAGPKGKFCLVPGQVPKKILFLSAGSGITPLMAMSRWLVDVAADVDVKFFNSVRSPDDIIFEHELTMMTSRYSLFEPIHVTASRTSHKGWTGLSGRISRAMLEMLVPDLPERHVYICGPEGFMNAAKEIVASTGFPMANYHAESFGGIRTSVANKPAPLSTHPGAAEPRADVANEAAAGAFAVEFAKSGKTTRADGKLPLLDVAEANDVDVGYSCRSGSCGECKVRLLKGKVTMSCEDGLDAKDREEGYILSCVGVPETDIVVDA